MFPHCSNVELPTSVHEYGLKSPRFMDQLRVSLPDSSPPELANVALQVKNAYAVYWHDTDTEVEISVTIVLVVLFVDDDVEEVVDVELLLVDELKEVAVAKVEVLVGGGNSGVVVVVEELFEETVVVLTVL